MPRLYAPFSPFCGTIPGMKLAAVCAAVVSISIPLAAEQARGSRPQAAAATSPDKIAEAYNQFLLGHRLEDHDDEAGGSSAPPTGPGTGPPAPRHPPAPPPGSLPQNTGRDPNRAPPA